LTLQSQRQRKSCKLQKESRATLPPSTSLVPVEIVPAQGAPTHELATHRARLSLHTATGHTIDVGTGFDGDTLLRILDVLAEAERC